MRTCAEVPPRSPGPTADSAAQNAPRAARVRASGAGPGAWQPELAGSKPACSPRGCSPRIPPRSSELGAFGGGHPPYLRACPLLSPFSEPRPCEEEKGPSPGRGRGPGPPDVSAHRGHRFLTTALGSLSEAFTSFPSHVWKWGIRSASGLADLT